MRPRAFGFCAPLVFAVVIPAAFVVACGDGFTLVTAPTAGDVDAADSGDDRDLSAISLPPDQPAGGDDAAMRDSNGSDVDKEGGSALDATVVDGAEASALPEAASIGTLDSEAGEICAAGYESCNKSCTRLSSDLHNCGACGHDCARLPNVSAQDLACVNGRCSYQCASGYSDCGDGGAGCGTSLQAASSCGGCGVSCGGSAPYCAMGDAGTYACTQVCGSGTVDCSGSCADLTTDPNNCKACGALCPAPSLGQATCSGALCGMTCSGSLSLCGAACVDERTDNAHCGGCGISCTPPQTCGGGGSIGACGCTPLTGCPSDKNCGTMDNGCGSGMLTCGTMSGNCPAGQTCGGGGAANVCGCASGLCPAVWDLSSWDGTSSLWGN